MCALVTGVQTCALPIFEQEAHFLAPVQSEAAVGLGHGQPEQAHLAHRPDDSRWNIADAVGLGLGWDQGAVDQPARGIQQQRQCRSEEHTSELQSLMRNSYAVFCLKKKKHKTQKD